jgi:hypothetical protein
MSAIGLGYLPKSTYKEASGALVAMICLAASPFATSREISVCTRLRGGPGRTRTSAIERRFPELTDCEVHCACAGSICQVLAELGVGGLYLYKLSMGFHVPFWRLCLCLAKLRFPAAETGVGGDSV